MEYAWFNNVETKPGIGYPKEWENQEKWKGGWVRAADGSIRPRIGGKFRVLANIFANPDLPEIDDYYEPFDFDYQHLHTAPKAEHQPVARRARWSPAAHGEDRVGPELGGDPRHRVRQAAARTRTSTRSRRTSTVSTRTPS